MCCKYSCRLLLIDLHITKVTSRLGSSRHGGNTKNGARNCSGEHAMNRSLKLSMWVALALGSNQVMALDLGQIQVKSALGQPLLAEIPLHPANPAELNNLTVQLASSEEFARAGIVGGRTTIPLNFSVTNVGGNQVIRITSSVAVEDPYLDLLIEVNGGSTGKSVREFAILLDPVGGSTAAPAAVAAAPAYPAPPHRSVSHAAPAVAAAPRQRHVAAVPKAEAAPAAASNGQYGPVQRGKTLSAIARSTANGVDVQQMMLALKQANPDAFYRDNINALKTGAVLRVPTSAEAQAMTLAAAVAEVRRQNSDWRARTPGKPAVVADAATRAPASGANGNTSAATGDRLALVPAKEGNDAGTPGTGGKGDKSASIRQDLMRTRESVASLEQQSAELKDRLKDLADINSKNEHMLSLKDNEIAELQAKLAAARKAAGQPVAAAATAASTAKATSAASVATAAALAETHAAPAAASTTTSVDQAPATAHSTATASTPASVTSAPAALAAGAAAAKPLTTPVVKPKPRVAPVVAEQPWYMQTWAWVAGAGAIVLLILLAMLGRRSAASSPKSASTLADRFDSTSSPAEHGIHDGNDVDQNELLDQLAEHPDDIYLHLELVTLYYSRRDVDHFEAAAEAMHAHITDPQQDEWQDVVHMGEDLVPGHPLFDNHPELPAHEATEARREFDIDDYAGEHHAPISAPLMPGMPPLPAGELKKVSEYSFNFDLTKPAVAGSAADVAHAAHVEPLYADTHEHIDTHAPAAVEPTSSWHFDESERAHKADDFSHDLSEFNDDPIDTKLDLARAYLDMGDADGAHAMLGEVLKEGSQIQQDVARRLLENLH